MRDILSVPHARRLYEVCTRVFRLQIPSGIFLKIRASSFLKCLAIKYSEVMSGSVAI